MGVAFGVGFIICFIICLVIIGIILISMALVGLVLIITGIIKNKKKIGNILLIIGMILIICSTIGIINIIKLFFVDSAEVEERRYRNSNIIIEALKKEDIELMESSFAKEVQSREELRKEIRAIYEYIDGDIISYEIGDVNRDGGRYGDEDEVYNNGSITKITTATGKKYDLYFGECGLYTKDKNFEGIMYVRVVSEGQDEVMAGIWEY